MECKNIGLWNLLQNSLSNKNYLYLLDEWNFLFDIIFYDKIPDGLILLGGPGGGGVFDKS